MTLLTSVKTIILIALFPLKHFYFCELSFSDMRCHCGHIVVKHQRTGHVLDRDSECLLSPKLEIRQVWKYIHDSAFLSLLKRHQSLQIFLLS